MGEGGRERRQKVPEMRLLACVALAAFTLVSCGRGFYPAPTDVTLPQLSLQTPVQQIVSFTDTAPLALYGSNAVVPLFAIPNIDTNIGKLDVAFWGTKDASGNITQLTEAGVSGLTSDVHIFFDTSERPIYFRDDASGYAIKLSYDSAAQQTVTVCDPAGSAIASSQILISGGAAHAGPAYAGGSCSLGPSVAAVRVRSGSDPGGVATNPSSIGSLATLITAGAYVAGFGFALGSILKFKAHKDNPTQTPLSKPIVLLFVAAALIFLPSIFKSTGGTLFESFAAASAADGLASFLPESSVSGCSTPSASCPFPSPDPTP